MTNWMLLIRLLLHARLQWHLYPLTPTLRGMATHPQDTHCSATCPCRRGPASPVVHAALQLGCTITRWAWVSRWRLRRLQVRPDACRIQTRHTMMNIICRPTFPRHMCPPRRRNPRRRSFGGMATHSMDTECSAQYYRCPSWSYDDDDFIVSNSIYIPLLVNEARLVHDE